YATQAPAVVVVYGPNDLGSGLHSSIEGTVRIADDHHHARRAAVERFRTEVLMLGRFVGNPKLGPLHRKPRDYGSVRSVEAESLCCAECGLVKVDGLGALSDREHWGDGCGRSLGGLRWAAHGNTSFRR